MIRWQDLDDRGARYQVIRALALLRKAYPETRYHYKIWQEILGIPERKAIKDLSKDECLLLIRRLIVRRLA